MQTRSNQVSKVLSLGAVAMDIVLASTGLPQDDGFSLVDSEVLVPGGSASNMSVALHRLGAEVWQAGKIGDDHYGIVFRQDLLNNGIHVEPLIVKQGGTTLHTYIITAPEGKHCIYANKGNCVLDLQPSELTEDVLDGCSCFYTDLFSANTALWLGKLARERGIPVVYNMQCAPSFMDSCGVSRLQLEQMLSTATLMIGGINSYQEFCGEQDPEAAAKAIYDYYRPKDGVICTCGSRGAVWCSAEGLIGAEAFSVNAVDTTGAGDTFCAGIIFERYCRLEKNISAILRFAAAAAALKCTVKGPRSISTYENVQAFLLKGESL